MTMTDDRGAEPGAKLTAKRRSMLELVDGGDVAVLRGVRWRHRGEALAGQDGRALRELAGASLIDYDRAAVDVTPVTLTDAGRAALRPTASVGDAAASDNAGGAGPNDR